VATVDARLRVCLSGSRLSRATRSRWVSVCRSWPEVRRNVTTRNVISVAGIVSAGGWRDEGQREAVHEDVVAS
jgi:hypothetical protein